MSLWCICSSVNVSLPPKSMKDGVYFLHMFVVPANHKPLSRSLKIAHSYTKLTQLSKPKAEAFNLMGGGSKNETGGKANAPSDTPVPHWRSRVTVSVMTEDISFDRSNFPREIISYVKERIEWTTMSYYPIALIDKLSFRIRDLMVCLSHLLNTVRFEWAISRISINSNAKGNLLLVAIMF